MKLTRLQLIRIRNQEDRTYEPGEGLTVFTGPNGAGKTNLIEAVYFASIGKSFRTARADDLIRWEAEEGTILVDFSLRGVVHRMKARLSRAEGARFFMNDTKLRRKDLLGTFRTVLFTPDELQLIKGAPSARRRFLDLEVAQVSPRYYEELLRYARAMAQRNAAIRQARFLGTAPDIDMWDMQIASGAAYLVKKRQEAAARMNECLAVTEAALTGGAERLTVRYLLHQGEGTPDESWYLERLAAARDEDIRLCRTSVGPHRDDLLFELNGRDIARFGSQGQQRTAILAMKLAEAEFIRRETGEYPVLLLDDIGSELDRTRREALFTFLREGGVQTLVTAAEWAGKDARVIAL